MATGEVSWQFNLLSPICSLSNDVDFPFTSLKFRPELTDFPDARSDFQLKARIILGGIDWLPKLTELFTLLGLLGLIAVA